LKIKRRAQDASIDPEMFMKNKALTIISANCSLSGPQTSYSSLAGITPEHIENTASEILNA
jgi:hypothetical protein